ncbi:MAG TPA: hypothetical protein VG675_21170 [Bryobacteraceae bacterium]|nr:hypothetical protein [Bryobacteraceae bacterium]
MTHSDPLQYQFALPVQAEFYPLGFPMRLRTNSREVCAAAEESFHSFRRLFRTPPLEIRVAVEDGGRADVPDPAWRAQEHLVALVSDAHNFAICDHSRAFSFCRLSAASAGRRAWVRWHFLEAIAYQLLTQLYLTPVHAGCVARQGRGVLLCGGAGAGKSSLSYACARAGWTYVSDNDSYLVRRDSKPSVIGKPHVVRFRQSASELFPELTGRFAVLQPNGRYSILLPTASIPSLRTALRVDVGALVFLNRVAGEARLTLLDPAEAHRRLCAEVPAGAGEVMAAQIRSLRRLSARGGFELRYGTVDSALSLLPAVLS